MHKDNDGAVERHSRSYIEDLEMSHQRVLVSKQKCYYDHTTVHYTAHRMTYDNG